MRVLVTGAAGLVGSRVVRQGAARGHEVHGTFHVSREELPCEWHALDRTDAPATLRVLEHVRPEVVVDCASWTDVDGCERDPPRAERENAQGARHVADAAARVGARVVHVGTDFVFDGKLQRPYTERDAPNPLGVYARTKLAAERAMLAHPANAVIRSAVIFGWHPRKRTFPEFVVRELRAGRPVRAAYDQRCTPTLASSLAGALLVAAERGVAGLFQFAGGDCATREELANVIARTFGLDEGLISGIRMADLGLPTNRPLQTCLDSTLAAQVLAVRPLKLGEAVERFRAEEPDVPALAGDATRARTQKS